MDRLGGTVGGSWRSGRNMTMKLGAAASMSLREDPGRSIFIDLSTKKHVIFQFNSIRFNSLCSCWECWTDIFTSLLFSFPGMLTRWLCRQHPAPTLRTTPLRSLSYSCRRYAAAPETPSAANAALDRTRNIGIIAHIDAVCKNSRDTAFDWY